MTLRTKLSLVLSVLLVLSIGLTGGILIYQSAQNSRLHITREHQLLAENRAFALRDNLEILEGELDRLALLPQVDLTDQNPQPEEQLLESAHHHSVLYNTAVLIISAQGDCIGAVPDRPEFRDRKFGGEPWFEMLRAGGGGARLRLAEDPAVGRTLNIVQPMWKRRAFAGAVMGVVALDQANVIVPPLRDDLPPSTEAFLFDQAGHVLYPTDRVSVAPDSTWATVVSRASGAGAASGTLTGLGNKEESLFAYAKVEGRTDFIVVFRRPWSVLVEHVHQQVLFLGAVLLFGVVVAAGAGLWLSAYLTRPLKVLRASAARLATGEHGATDHAPPRVGGDELTALVDDFLRMELSIRQRDRELREAANSLEQRVRERTLELEAAQKALVLAERFAGMGKASAAIAHELKNALNGLGMAVELILENPHSSRVGRLKVQVLSEIERLRDVVDSLSSFSLSPRIETKAEDLSSVVRRAVDLLGDLITDRGATVRVDIPEHLTFACDGHKIQGVVMNLLKNAVEAARVVQIRAEITKSGAVIVVSDDGPDISDEVRSHLFEPFFTTKPNGTGLGLATSLRYVKAHGGTLEARRDSVLGGALFEVRLPPADAADAAGVETPFVAAGTSAGSINGRT